VGHQRQTKETFPREEDDMLRGQGKGKHQVPILKKPNKRLIMRRKAQGMMGGCKEYHSTNESKQRMLCMEGRKL
jgi:hypothetical protein